METIEISVPQELYDSLYAQSQALRIPVDALASLWLWESDWRRRTNGELTTGTTASAGNGDLSAGEDAR